MKRRQLILTEVEDRHGIAHLTLEQRGEFTAQDLERILKNALFGVEKQYERQLSAIASTIIGAAQMSFEPFGAPYHLQAHTAPVLPGADVIQKRLLALSGEG